MDSNTWTNISNNKNISFLTLANTTNSHKLIHLKKGLSNEQDILI